MDDGPRRIPDFPRRGEPAVDECFGNGIVATQENFGMQGDAPSHQELLDTLALRFCPHRLGCETDAQAHRAERDVPAVVGRTPRRSARSDPKNQLLSRGPSYRLSGEAIRDQALLAAGLLVEKGRRTQRETVATAGRVVGSRRLGR